MVKIPVFKKKKKKRPARVKSQFANRPACLCNLEGKNELSVFVIFEFESLIFTFNTVYVNLQCCWATFATSVIVLLFSVTQSTCLCLSFLRYTSIFFCSYNIEPVKPIPTATGQEVVTSLSQGIAPLQNRKIRVNTFTPTANLENLFNSTSCLCMSLRGWLESLERTHTDKGRTCNLYAEKCQAGVKPRIYFL